MLCNPEQAVGDELYRVHEVVQIAARIIFRRLGGPYADLLKTKGQPRFLTALNAALCKADAIRCTDDSAGALRVLDDAYQAAVSEDWGPYLERTSDVGSYAPNAWGLYDMHGNVWEWCLDAAEFDGNVKTDTYVEGVVDPLCKVGRCRVNRGGGWIHDGRICRSAHRDANEPGVRRDGLGFRVCLARSPAGGEP